MPNKYEISDYNSHLSLKVNAMMWCIILFLMRPFLVAVFSITNRKDRMGMINFVYDDKLSMSLSAYAALPVILLMYAFIKRSPGATDFVKRVWVNGQHLLATTAVLHIIIISAPLWMQNLTLLSNVAMLQVALSFLIIVMVYRTDYIKDCFNDFPELPENDDSQ